MRTTTAPACIRAARRYASAHGSPQQYLVRSIQANETHTFNSHLLNEAAFGFLRMEGLI